MRWEGLADHVDHGLLRAPIRVRDQIHLVLVLDVKSLARIFAEDRAGDACRLEGGFFQALAR